MEFEMMVVGSVVSTKKSGLSVKNSDFAIVVSLSPFVLVSSCFSMVWEGQDPDNFEETHQTHPDITRKAIKTWKNGFFPIETIEQGIDYRKKNIETFVGATRVAIGRFSLRGLDTIQIFREDPADSSSPSTYK